MPVFILKFWAIDIFRPQITACRLLPITDRINIIAETHNLTTKCVHDSKYRDKAETHNLTMICVHGPKFWDKVGIFPSKLINFQFEDKICQKIIVQILNILWQKV